MGGSHSQETLVEREKFRDRSCDAYARFSSRVQAALPQRVRASANCGRTGPIDPSRTSARRTEVDRDMKLRGPQAAVRGRKVSSTQSVNVTRGQFADTGPGQTALASCSYTSRALTVPSSAPISASSSWLTMAGQIGVDHHVADITDGLKILRGDVEPREKTGSTASACPAHYCGRE